MENFNISNPDSATQDKKVKDSKVDVTNSQRVNNESLYLINSPSA